MNPKRWIAAIAALVLAGAASVFIANPAMSHDGENHDGENHGEETTTTAPMEHDDGHDHGEETTTTVPADDGADEPAPPVEGEPGFTG